MSDLETTIYVVGAKRRWALRGRVLRRVITFIVIILLGLALTITYLVYSHQKVVSNLQEQFDQEALKSAKLQALLVDRNTQEALAPEVQSPEEKSLTDQQAELIERQKRQLQELRDSLRQRELVVQQLEIEKRSSQGQIDDLQEQLRETETALRQVEAEVEDLRDQNLAESGAPPQPERNSEVSSDKMLLVEALKMNLRDSVLSLRFNLTNNTGEIQQGRVGVLLVGKDQLSEELEYNPARSIPFRIRRFRVISKEYQVNSPDQYVRIVAWNDDQKMIMDENFPVSSN